jgi:hypothetical protein
MNENKGQWKPGQSGNLKGRPRKLPGRDISELVNQQQGKPESEKQETPEELNRRMYLEDLARFRDFTPEAERILWPTPIGPHWKN